MAFQLMALSILVEPFVTGPLDTNMLLVRNVQTNHSIIVDPGARSKKMEKRIEAEGLSVDAILLTHAHFDHCFAAQDYKEKYGAKVYMHPLDKPTAALNPQLASFLGLETPETYPFHVDVEIHDGDVLDLLDTKFKVIHTPGHTPGSVCYLVNDDKLLLAGDTIFLYGEGRTDLPGGNGKELEQSIKKLRDVVKASTLVYPGHGDSFSASQREFAIE